MIGRAPDAFQARLLDGADGSAVGALASKRKSPPMTLRVQHLGAVTALHYDDSDTALLVLDGAKEVMLWPDRLLAATGPYPREHFM